MRAVRKIIVGGGVYFITEGGQSRWNEENYFNPVKRSEKKGIIHFPPKVVY